MHDVYYGWEKQSKYLQLYFVNLCGTIVCFCSKTLFWLPRILPPKAHFIVSLNASDDKKLAELTEERGYDTINIAPLKEPEREEIALVRYIMHQELHLTNEARTSVQIAYF